MKRNTKKLDQLRELCLEANRELPARGLVLYSWGNVSLVDHDEGIVVIKPAGVPYQDLTPGLMSVTDLEGNVLSSPRKPSVDLPIHLVLFKKWPSLQSIVHTHSTYATMWAQAMKPIPCYGTTHADYFYGEVPCTRILKKKEVEKDYEENTGLSIVEALKERDPLELPGALAAGHGPFTWGKDPWEAVHNSVVLEEIAKMAAGSLMLDPKLRPVPSYLLDGHFLRKHGANAYFDIDDMGAK
jgi:L-ribulose-5-phosphate 4-epimerase